jgi:hypothetical protein
MEDVDLFYDFARSRRWTRAFGIVGQMPLMKVDANDGCVRERNEFFEACWQVASVPVNIDVHSKHSLIQVAYATGRNLFPIRLVIFNHAS